jgi:hypothetical protein
MRALCLAFTFLLLSVAAEPQAVDPQLKLHAEIVSQRYCEVDEEIFALRIPFRISLINGRTSSVVVSRRIDPLVLVSRTLGDARSGRHEFEINPADDFPQPPPSRDAIQKEMAEQPVVRPGEKFDAETMEAVLLTPKTEHYPKQEALALGVHWVQVVISVKDEGSGTYLSAVSQPMKVTVEQYPSSEKCESKGDNGNPD